MLQDLLLTAHLRSFKHKLYSSLPKSELYWFHLTSLQFAYCDCYIRGIHKLQKSAKAEVSFCCITAAFDVCKSSVSI